MQSAIQLRHLYPDYSEVKAACVGRTERTLAERRDAIAELEAYLQEAGTLTPRTRRLSWARLQVLAEFL